jgi:hypothetical protein
MSGKLNELISLLVGNGDAPPRRPDERRIEAEPPLGPRRFGLFHSALNACEDELAGGTAFASGSFVQAAMEIARKVDGSADGCRLHAKIMIERLK